MPLSETKLFREILILNQDSKYTILYEDACLDYAFKKLSMPFFASDSSRKFVHNLLIIQLNK